MKIKTSDVVLWLSIPGRRAIATRHAEIINPYRSHIHYVDGRPTARFAILLDRSFFLKGRQKDLAATFEKLAPYELIAEIAIYHPSDKASFSVEIPTRITNSLTVIGAKLRIVSYLSD